MYVIYLLHIYELCCMLVYVSDSANLKCNQCPNIFFSQSYCYFYASFELCSMKSFIEISVLQTELYRSICLPFSSRSHLY